MCCLLNSGKNPSCYVFESPRRVVIKLHMFTGAEEEETAVRPLANGTTATAETAKRLVDAEAARQVPACTCLQQRISRAELQSPSVTCNVASISSFLSLYCSLRIQTSAQLCWQLQSASSSAGLCPLSSL